MTSDDRTKLNSVLVRAGSILEGDGHRNMANECRVACEHLKKMVTTDNLLALTRRVHAECGPEVYNCVPPFWICTHQSCRQSALTAAEIKHKPDCLWLAADALLRKAGAI